MIVKLVHHSTAIMNHFIDSPEATDVVPEVSVPAAVDCLFPYCGLPVLEPAVVPVAITVELLEGVVDDFTTVVVIFPSDVNSVVVVTVVVSALEAVVIVSINKQYVI